jgi:hypothetical protein
MQTDFSFYYFRGIFVFIVEVQFQQQYIRLQSSRHLKSFGEVG